MTNVENIMEKFNINHANKTIIMPKSIAKKASTYGTNEYKALIEIQSAFPSYDLKIREVNRTPSRRDSLKGLTFEYMERFVAKNGTDLQKEAFEALRNPIHDDGLKSERKFYGTIRKWFLKEFPQVLDYQKKVDEILTRESA